MLGGVVETAFAALQRIGVLHSPALAPVEGRYQALLDNPVYLSGLLLAVVGLTFRRQAGERSVRAWAVVAYAALMVSLGLGLEYSGERLGIAAGAGSVIVALLSPALRSARRRVVLLALALAFGVALGNWSLPGGAPSASSQLAATSQHNLLYGRVYSWETAIRATLVRPVAGWGPGRYETATESRRTLLLARAEGGDVVFSDAHNLVVEYLTTTGILGLASLLAFLGFAARSSRGPLAWAAALIFLHLLLEPQSVEMTTLGALCLGGAVPRGPLAAYAPSRALSVGSIAGAGAGAVLGSCLLAGTALMTPSRPVADLMTATKVLPPWPDVPDAVARRVYFDNPASARGSPNARQAEHYALMAAEDDPASEVPWGVLGDLDAVYGDRTGAVKAYEHAVSDNPWAAAALSQLVVVTTDTPTRTWACERLRLLGDTPTGCEAPGSASSSADEFHP